MRLPAMIRPTLSLRPLLPALALLPLAACISFGAEPPPQLLTLTAVSQPAIGQPRSGATADAITVLAPETDRTLDTVRVPVQINDSAIAYVEDAIWAEKPARLFRGVLAETIAASSGRLVLDEIEAGGERGTLLGGQLKAFGYDADRGDVVVHYDAVLRTPGQPLRKQRFEARAPLGGKLAPDTVGAALNRAANEVAAAVAGWAAS